MLARVWRVSRRYKAYIVWLTVCSLLLVLLFHEADDPRAHQQRMRMLYYDIPQSHNASVSATGTSIQPHTVKPRPTTQVIQSEDSQSARKRHVLQTCKTYGDQSTLQPARLYVLDKYKAVFCMLANAGLEEWKDYFKQACLQKPVFCGNMTGLDQYSQKEQEKILKSYYKVMFVRDPLDELWSTHTDNLIDINPEKYLNLGTQIVKVVRPKADETSLVCGDNVTFPEFLRYISYQHKHQKQLDETWGTFHTSCDPCNIPYNHIGKMETFYADFKSISKPLKLTNVKVPRTAWLDIRERLKQSFLNDSFTKQYNQLCHLKANLFQIRKWKTWINQGLVDPSDLKLQRMLKIFPFSEKDTRDWVTWSSKVVDYILDEDLTKIHRKEEAMILMERRKERVKSHQYQKIQQKIWNQIQNIYKVDLEMFGYTGLE